MINLSDSAKRKAKKKRISGIASCSFLEEEVHENGKEGCSTHDQLPPKIRTPRRADNESEENRKQKKSKAHSITGFRDSGDSSVRAHLKDNMEDSPKKRRRWDTDDQLPPKIGTPLREDNEKNESMKRIRDTPNVSTNKSKKNSINRFQDSSDPSVRAHLKDNIEDSLKKRRTEDPDDHDQLPPTFITPLREDNETEEDRKFIRDAPCSKLQSITSFQDSSGSSVRAHLKGNMVDSHKKTKKTKSIVIENENSKESNTDDQLALKIRTPRRDDNEIEEDRKHIRDTTSGSTKKSEVQSITGFQDSSDSSVRAHLKDNMEDSPKKRRRKDTDDQLIPKIRTRLREDNEAEEDMKHIRDTPTDSTKKSKKHSIIGFQGSSDSSVRTHLKDNMEDSPKKRRKDTDDQLPPKIGTPLQEDNEKDEGMKRIRDIPNGSTKKSKVQNITSFQDSSDSSVRAHLKDNTVYLPKKRKKTKSVVIENENTMDCNTDDQLLPKIRTPLKEDNEVEADMKRIRDTPTCSTKKSKVQRVTSLQDSSDSNKQSNTGFQDSSHSFAGAHVKNDMEDSPKKRKKTKSVVIENENGKDCNTDDQLLPKIRTPLRDDNEAGEDRKRIRDTPTCSKKKCKKQSATDLQDHSHSSLGAHLKDNMEDSPKKRNETKSVGMENEFRSPQLKPTTRSEIYEFETDQERESNKHGDVATVGENAIKRRSKGRPLGVKSKPKAKMEDEDAHLQNNTIRYPEPFIKLKFVKRRKTICGIESLTNADESNTSFNDNATESEMKDNEHLQTKDDGEIKNRRRGRPLGSKNKTKCQGIININNSSLGQNEGEANVSRLISKRRKTICGTESGICSSQLKHNDTTDQKVLSSANAKDDIENNVRGNTAESTKDSDYFPNKSATDIIKNRGRGRPLGSKNKPKTENLILPSIKRRRQTICGLGNGIYSSQLKHNDTTERQILSEADESKTVNDNSGIGAKYINGSCKKKKRGRPRKNPLSLSANDENLHSEFHIPSSEADNIDIEDIIKHLDTENEFETNNCARDSATDCKENKSALKVSFVGNGEEFQDCEENNNNSSFKAPFANNDEELQVNGVDEISKLAELDEPPKKKLGRPKKIRTEADNNDNAIPQQKRGKGRPPGAKNKEKPEKTFIPKRPILEKYECKKYISPYSGKRNKNTGAVIDKMYIRKIPQARLEESLTMLNSEHPIWEERNTSCLPSIHRYWQTPRIQLCEQRQRLKYARLFMLRRDWANLSKVLCIAAQDKVGNVSYYPLLAKYGALCLAHTDKEQFKSFVHMLVNMEDSGSVLKKCTQLGKQPVDEDLSRNIQ